MKLSTEPSKTEAVLILAFTFLVQILEASRTVGWRARATGLFDNLDNSWYISLADFIRQWTPITSFERQGFWGYPYFILTVSKIFHLRYVDAAISISIAASIGTCLLVHELYGGRVAVALGMVSSTWILLSVFGACEPLFMCLLFASFLAVRREQWTVAALLASVATAVRPLGALAVLSMLTWLLWRRRWVAAAQVFAIPLLLAVVYLIPVYILTGDAWIQFRLYSGDWQIHDFPLAHRGILSFPGLRLVQSFYYLHEHWRTWNASVRKIGWIIVTLGGGVLLWSPRRWRELPPVETIFACAYIAFLICYNFDYVAMYLERFILPVLPLILFAVRKWIPVDRRVLWPLAALSIVLNTVLLFHRF